MSLDTQIVEEVLGINVFLQLRAVEPTFFDERYLILKLVPMPEDRQHEHYPHVVYLEPKVVASTDQQYQVGEVIEVKDRLAELIVRGNNVVVSPNKIRREGLIGREILEGEPEDRLVIAEVDPTPGGFGSVKSLYAHNALLGHGKIGSRSRISFEDFDSASVNTYVHFAFLPRKDTPRRECYLDKGFELKF